MTEKLGLNMAIWSLERLLQYGEQNIHQTVPLALCIFLVSNPKVKLINGLIAYGFWNGQALLKRSSFCFPKLMNFKHTNVHSREEYFTCSCHQGDFLVVIQWFGEWCNANKCDRQLTLTLNLILVHIHNCHLECKRKLNLGIFHT